MADRESEHFKAPHEHFIVESLIELTSVIKKLPSDEVFRNQGHVTLVSLLSRYDVAACINTY